MLVRQVIRVLLSEQAQAPDQEIICRNVTGFTAQYFDGTVWNSVWDSTQENNTVPMAVQLTLSVQDQNNQIHNYTHTFMLACSTAAVAGPNSTAATSGSTSSTGLSTGLP